jgi:hypothetical protein
LHGRSLPAGQNEAIDSLPDALVARSCIP